MVVFTLDTDWASPEVMQYVFDEVIDPRLALTVFCTDDYQAVRRRERTEAALHYNVETLGFVRSYREIAARLPDAIGSRGHSLAFSERLRAVFYELGIHYDSSYLMYELPEIRPFLIGRDVWEFPIYFMDTFFMEYCEADPSRAPGPDDLATPGLKVLDFHPIHLLANTPSLDYYERMIRPCYHDFPLLLQRRHDGWGMRTLFEELQARVLAQGLPQRTLAELTTQLLADEREGVAADDVSRG